MTYTDYVELDEKLNEMIEKRGRLDIDINRCQSQLRAATADFPREFYVKVGEKMVFRTDPKEDVRIVCPETE